MMGKYQAQRLLLQVLAMRQAAFNLTKLKTRAENNLRVLEMNSARCNFKNQKRIPGKKIKL